MLQTDPAYRVASKFLLEIRQTDEEWSFKGTTSGSTPRLTHEKDSKGLIGLKIEQHAGNESGTPGDIKTPKPEHTVLPAGGPGLQRCVFAPGHGPGTGDNLLQSLNSA